MQELDDFEKYLREQLKGHQAPHELMWKRLHDVVGKPKAWYAKSLVKYGLTAVGSALIGSVVTFNALKTPKTVANETQSVTSQSLAKNQTQQATELAQLSNNNSEQARNPENKSSIGSAIYRVGNTLNNTENLIVSPTTSAAILNQTTTIAANEEQALNLLATKPLQRIQNTPKKLQQLSLTKNRAQLLSLQVYGSKSAATLRSPGYLLNNSASYTQAVKTIQKPSVQLQFFLPKNWIVGIGAGQQLIDIHESFYKTNVYSYDDKEHYLFNYILGQRKVSDEELEDGPWPNFPPSPFGSDTSHVHTNYMSNVQLKTVQVPFTFGYQKTFRNFALQFTTGLTLDYLTEATQTLSIPGYAPSVVSIIPKMNRVSWQQTQNFRFEYLANRHLGIYLEPRYAIQIKNFQSLNQQGFSLNQWQLNTGISWKF
ncbi:MAG: hypothetical protein ACKOBN_02080 [Flavobacteriales bacterium]